MKSQIPQSTEETPCDGSERQRANRFYVSPDQQTTVVLHCDGNEIPAAVCEYSDLGICVVTEVLDMARFPIDPISSGDRLHVQLDADLYEGIARHVTAADGTFAIGVEWTPYTLGIMTS